MAGANLSVDMDQHAPDWVLVRKRLDAWIKSTGLTRTQVAAKIGCDTSYLSLLLSMEETPPRWPGRRIANAIERESTDWADGAITSEEWDRAESAFNAAKTSAGNAAA